MPILQPIFPWFIIEFTEVQIGNLNADRGRITVDGQQKYSIIHTDSDETKQLGHIQDFCQQNGPHGAHFKLSHISILKPFFSQV